MAQLRSEIIENAMGLTLLDRVAVLADGFIEAMSSILMLQFI